MKLAVDAELCISCGLCIETSPEVFDWDSENKAKVIIEGDLPAELVEEAREAMENCPTEAIQEVV